MTRWAQLAFSEIIGGIYAVVIQKGKEMIALFVEPFTDGFFAGLAAGEAPAIERLHFRGSDADERRFPG
jgi:hypothetical protein